MLDANDLLGCLAALSLLAAPACTAPAIDYEGMVPLSTRPMEPDVWGDGLSFSKIGRPADPARAAAPQAEDGPISILAWPVGAPAPPAAGTYISIVSMGRLSSAPLDRADPGDGPLGVRLLIGTDGKTKKATFLGGSRGLWRAIKAPLLDVEWRIEQNELPGPWEMDWGVRFVERGRSRHGLVRYDLIYIFISYRTAKA